MSRQTPFARAFVPWIAEWSRMGLSGTQERVLLLLVSRMESDGRGGWVAWFPRAEMSEVLELSEETVRRAIRHLVEKGAIKRIGKAYSSTVQKYKLMPNYKGGISGHPIKTERGAQSDQKGVPSTPIKGVSPGIPIRTKECASASLSQPSARNRYKQADGTDNAVL